MENNMLLNEQIRKAERLKTILDLVALEICATSLALVFDCLVFFNYFGNAAIPIAIIGLLIALSVGSVLFRKAYLEKVWADLGLADIAPLSSFKLGAKANRRIGNIITYIVLISMSLIWLFPFFGIVLESFRVESTGQKEYLFPQQWGFDNYRYLIMNEDNNGFMRWFINTAFVGVITSVLQTGFILAMSYTLSRLRFKMRKFLMNFMLILGMFPGFLTLILIFKVFADAKLIENNASIGLIIVYCASSAMGYYVSKGFFDTIPKTLDEAARVDGATRWQVFYKVIMPLSKPIVIYTILMGFMAPWGDYMLANWLAHGASAGKNVATGMMDWMGRNIEQHYTHFCAGGVLVAIPVIIVFLCLQKYYVEGVTGGAVKG